MRLALAGDTMLGRGVAERLREVPVSSLVDGAIVEALAEADLVLLNLECAVSERGSRWPDPAKPFFFRAPPAAVDLLTHLGVGCVTLANNHALDYGRDALLDTIELVSAAGIYVVGAGVSQQAARTPARLRVGDTTLAIMGVTDHPAEYAATATDPGVAYADLAAGTPSWLTDGIHGAGADVVVVTPHWGPNMVAEPVPHVRRAAQSLMSAGAALVAGHSAHVFQGVSADGVLFDLGDFIDDYATDPRLRNDLGLLFFVTLNNAVVSQIEAMPLKLRYCHTSPATGDDARWIARRFRAACQSLGTSVVEREGRLLVRLH